MLRGHLRVLLVEEESIGTNALKRCKVPCELGFKVDRPHVPVFISSYVLVCSHNNLTVRIEEKLLRKSSVLTCL